MRIRRRWRLIGWAALAVAVFWASLIVFELLARI